MEDVGVRAVVENTQKFMSDMKKINVSVEGFAEKIFDMGTAISSSQLQKLGIGILDVQGALSKVHPLIGLVAYALKLLGNDIGRLGNDIKTVLVSAFNIAIGVIKTFGNIIKTVLTPVRSVIDAFVGSLRRIGEIASGILIANTVRKLADTIRDMATSALDAAINFQTLEVRLQGLAARQIFNEGNVENFGQALDQASGKASKLLDWVIDLSLKAPISTDAIANTLTLATSYGLGEEAAKKMTTAVLTFASGMGLTDVAQRRIIENFGQMIQQGKITSMELRDMGRGAFVPVGDLLNKTAELLGMTSDEFDGTAASINKFADSKGLDSVMTMMEAFIQLTETEFEGAIERMGATIQGLRQRFKNLVSAIIGLNVLKPSLDLLGGSISKIFDAIAESEGIKTASKEIGEALAGMVGDLLGEMPSVEVIVGKIETALNNVRDAIGFFREGDTMGGLATLGVPQSFLDFIQKVKDFTIPEGITTFIDNVRTSFENLKDFWDTNGDTIKEALRIAAGEILDALGMGKGPGRDERRRFDPANMMPEGGLFGDLNVDEILETINGVKDGIIKFIEAIQSIPETIETVKPWFPVIVGLFLLLRYPILTIYSLMIGLPIALAVSLDTMVKNFLENQPKWFSAGADLCANLLAGLKDGWTKIWAWAVAQWQKLVDLWNSIPFFGSGGGGGSGAPTSSMTGTQVATGAPTSNNVTNNTINMKASYSKTQSPARIRDDVTVLMSKLR